MRKLAILIPAHNEEVVIKHTLSTLNKFVFRKDIYVVDDGSTDKTSKIAKNYTKNIIKIFPNKGKANALNSGISHFNLANRYKFIMPLDADSQINKEFVEKILNKFREEEGVHDKQPKDKVVCVVGRVMSRKQNWISYYRMWEYEIAQSIHKNAQGIINSVVVCPGCSTIFKAALFKKTKIPTGTLTEDMDLTFTIYRKRLGKIIFINSAQILTQDPKNLKDLLRQLDRWYTGFWQCVLKHDIPWGGQALDLEVALLATEGLFGGLVILALFFAVPFALNLKPSILIAPIAFDFLLFVMPTVVFAGIKNRSLGIFRYISHFYIVRVLSSLVFLKSFLKVVFAIDLKATWDKALRYTIAK